MCLCGTASLAALAIKPCACAKLCSMCLSVREQESETESMMSARKDLRANSLSIVACKSALGAFTAVSVSW